MCFISIIVGVVLLVMYWLGFLDRPVFQVVESSLCTSSKDDADGDHYYAIVATSKDEDYIDNNICKVLSATKKGIEASLKSGDDGEISPGGDENGGRFSFATSYDVAHGSDSPSTGKSKVDEGSKPGGEDNIGITIFLQDQATGDCHETAAGFVLKAPSLRHAQNLAKKVTKKVRADLGRWPPDRDESECSHDWGPSSAAEVDDINQHHSFFRVHAVSLGMGAVFRGRIPIRSRIAFYVARYMHWGRAYKEYSSLMSSEPKGAKGGAVACEIYVNGQHNPAIGRMFVDYLYLLDPYDRETVWKHLNVSMPCSA
jgi:hypothetical protein